MFDTARQQLKAQLMTGVELGVGVLSALGVPMALVLGKLLLAGLLGMIAIGVGLRFVRARKPTATDQ
jgi:cadmium resistance protein CadD (predicted permease)